jgi:heme/copper-type cytochrome/quinol oxidase subunit 3
MLLFLASEAVFFALLIIAFVIYHREAGNAAEVAGRLNTTRTGAFTAVLLSSSLTAWLALRLHRKGRKTGSHAMIFLTMLLGAIFLFGQGQEYASLIRENVTISRDLFGTTFFTLTGFHGLHVLFGLVMLGTLLGIGVAWNQTEPTPSALESVSLYWHFVDLVWLVIFPVVYLWGNL